jgi:hypothetical protein
MNELTLLSLVAGVTAPISLTHSRLPSLPPLPTRRFTRPSERLRSPSAPPRVLTNPLRKIAHMMILLLLFKFN